MRQQMQSKSYDILPHTLEKPRWEITVARLEDIELRERLLLKGYPFKRFARRINDPVSSAMTPLKKPLQDCMVALVTTAGLSLPDQPPFDMTIRMGDTSFREIPGNISANVGDESAQLG